MNHVYGCLDVYSMDSDVDDQLYSVKNAVCAPGHSQRAAQLATATPPESRTLST